MKKLIFAIGLIFAVLATSCIPQKEIVYLQNDSGDQSQAIKVVEKPKPYRIQVNDIISIRVKALDQNSVTILNPVGDENLNASGAERGYFDGFTVDSHGNIRVPTLGEINVLGKTTKEIEVDIETKLLEEQFKETANIFVTVKLSGLRFTVNGEINSPGTYTLFQERVNIFEAIANAGEIPITGDRKDIIIVRQYPQGQRIHHLDLTDVAVLTSQFYNIQNGDIIYIKPLAQKSWGTGTTGVQSLTTIISVLSLVTTSILLFRNL